MTKQNAIETLKKEAKKFEDAGYNAGMYYLIIDALRKRKGA